MRSGWEDYGEVRETVRESRRSHCGTNHLRTYNENSPFQSYATVRHCTSASVLPPARRQWRAPCPRRRPRRRPRTTCSRSCVRWPRRTVRALMYKVHIAHVVGCLCSCASNDHSSSELSRNEERREGSTSFLWLDSLENSPSGSTILYFMQVVVNLIAHSYLCYSPSTINANKSRCRTNHTMSRKILYIWIH